MSILNCVTYLTTERCEPFQVHRETNRGIVDGELFFSVDHLLAAFTLVFIRAAEVINLHKLGNRLFQGGNALYVETEVEDSIESIGGVSARTARHT